jgi:hypothetical protein
MKKEEETNKQNKPKSKKSECGFLMWKEQPQQTATILTKEDLKQYPNLYELMHVERTAESPDPDERDLADMM